MANCTTYLYDDSRLGCALPSGHDGPRVTGSGRGWHDSPDYMDGGVTAAAIEKEAEKAADCEARQLGFICTREKDHNGPHIAATTSLHHSVAEVWDNRPQVDWEALAKSEEKRAEKAEQERDRWHSMWRQRAIKHLAAEKRATRAEAQSAIRGRAVAIYQQRAREAEAERDGWRQTALDERGAALDALEQIKARDARIKAVEDVLGNPINLTDWDDPLVPAEHVRRALDGDA